MAKRLKKAEIDDRVRVAYQLRKIIGADRALFYDKIWLWPAPVAPLGPRRWKIQLVEEQSAFGLFSDLRYFWPEHNYLWGNFFPHSNRTVLYRVVDHATFEPICVVCEGDTHLGDELQSYWVCTECFNLFRDVPDFFA